MDGCLTTTRPSAFLVASVLVVASFVALVAFSAPAEARSGPPITSGLTPHNPIVIDGNGEFTPANGVVSGNGTPTDPFILEGWDIAAPAAGSGVSIVNTTASFTLRDTRVVGSGGVNTADVSLQNVSGGFLENLTLSGDYFGIRLVVSSDITIADSNVTAATGNGIFAFGSDRLNVTRNQLFVPQVAAMLVSYVTDSSVSGNMLTGADLTHSQNISVANNTLRAGAYTLVLENSQDIRVLGNDFADSGTLLAVLDSVRVNVSANRFTDGGISLWGTSREQYASHTITPDNLVSGKPLRYHSNCAGATIDGLSTGQLIIANCSGVRVANLTIASAFIGAILAYSASVNISSLSISGWNMIGIRMDHVDAANLTSIQVSGSGYSSMEAVSVANLTVQTYLSTSPGYGVDVSASRGVRISGAVIQDAYAGLVIDRTQGFRIEESRFVRSTSGIEITNSANGLVANTSIEISQGLNVFPQDGLYGASSTNVSVVGTFIANYSKGVELANDAGWVLYGNRLVYNIVQAVDGPSAANQWDGGYPTGGNYWTDYRGWDDCRGPSQTDCTGGDGFGDTPYVINGLTEDRYPIVYANPPNIPPVAAIAAIPVSVTPGQVIIFNGSGSHDPDGTIATYAWVFGDGGTANTSTATHAYTQVGNYTVRLTVTDNRRGANSTSVVAQVANPAPPSLALVIWTSRIGYQLPVPRDWIRSENVSVAGTTFELLLAGAYNGGVAEMLVNSRSNAGAQEDSAYLDSMVNQSVSDVQSRFPDAHLLAPAAFRTLSGHAAATIVIVYNSSIGPVFQDVALIVSAAHQRTWTIVLSALASERANLSDPFERILSGFLITAPPIMPPSGISPLVFEVAVGVVAAIAVVAAVIAFVAITRIRRTRFASAPKTKAPPPPGMSP